MADARSVAYPHLERLSRVECRQLLPGASVGRLAVPSPHFPTLEPVSFAVVEGELVVAVRAGSAGEAVAAETVVTFEADVVDNAGRQGWSVVVSGRVEELDADVAAVVRPELRPWPVTDADRLLLIRSERISGQRVVAGPDPAKDIAGTALPAERPVGAARYTRRSVATDEALRLVAKGGQQVGRLVVGVPGEPAVFPLNFVVDGDAVVFRTQVGTKLTAITRSLVTFEVDDIDATGHGWAVCFQGLAQEVLEADPEALHARIAATSVDTWPGGERAHVVRILPYRVEGTAFLAAEVAAGAPRP
ncbi:MAG TPA: pyridoxamine 5'-phosphate oxidase family protein [Acidimicrobiia bacterium]|nr:pyridoxamine 5'-phosphate oxidase family protein [Acidimicrobiia bacterium]